MTPFTIFPMKVNLAAQILSHEVAEGIRTFITHGYMPEEARDTADLCDEVNSMWNLVNSKSIDSPEGKKAVSRRDWPADNERFERFYSFVSSFKFLSPDLGQENKTFPAFS